MKTTTSLQRACTASIRTMAGTSLRELKTSLRKRISAQIATLTEKDIEAQSMAMTEHVLKSEQYQNAKAISIFLSMPKREISTRDIVVDAFRNNKSVFIPYIHSVPGSKTKTMDMLELRDDMDLNLLVPDPWGIPSLPRQSVENRRNAIGGSGIRSKTGAENSGVQRLDLIFMPAVAFDRSYHRLGHGKGFYDRYLQEYKDAAQIQPADMPTLIGLSLRQQILSQEESVPTNEDDWKVDSIFTADGQL